MRKSPEGSDLPDVLDTSKDFRILKSAIEKQSLVDPSYLYDLQFFHNDFRLTKSQQERVVWHLTKDVDHFRLYNSMYSSYFKDNSKYQIYLPPIKAAPYGRITAAPAFDFMMLYRHGIAGLDTDKLSNHLIDLYFNNGISILEGENLVNETENKSKFPFRVYKKEDKKWYLYDSYCYAVELIDYMRMLDILDVEYSQDTPKNYLKNLLSSIEWKTFDGKDMSDFIQNIANELDEEHVKPLTAAHYYFQKYSRKIENEKFRIVKEARNF